VTRVWQGMLPRTVAALGCHCDVGLVVVTTERWCCRFRLGARAGTGYFCLTAAILAVVPRRCIADRPPLPHKAMPLAGGWASHATCAEIVQRFDFSANYTETAFRRFHTCVELRAELPDWRSTHRPALLAGEDFPVTVTPSPRSPPGFWVLPAWDYVVSNYVRREGTFEPGELQIFKSLIEVGDVVCDVGAHVGSYTVPIATHVGRRGAVHSFEPFRLVYQLLMANVAVNGISNVYGHQLALGGREELRTVMGPALTRTSNIGATRVFAQVPPHFVHEHVLQYGEEEIVRVVPLDSLGLEHVNFVKIDVEGSLDMVLRGASRTIARHRPVLAVEHSDETPPSVLVEWGYRCVLAMPVHDLWVCVPHERFWRHAWLANIRVTGRTGLLQPGSVSPSAGLSTKAKEKEAADRRTGLQRRAVPPPALQHALQEV